MPDVYQTLYVDKDENTFVGEPWVAEDEATFNKALDLEAKVFAEIPVIEKIVIVTPVTTILREEKIVETISEEN